MIQGVGRDGGLARAAIEAALKSVGQNAARVDEQAAQAFDGASALGKAAAQPSFAETLSKGVDQANAAAKSVESLPLDLLSGRIADFHEVAGQLKQAEIMFKFSLEVRNKLIDAYRETMRMSV